MSEHFLIRCRVCRTVISQCRCASPTKTERLSTCHACAAKPPHVGEELAAALHVPIYTVNEEGAVPQALIDQLLEAPVVADACMHRYVRPEIPFPVFPGEASREVLTRCVDCGQALGLKVTVQVVLVPLS